MSAAPSLAGRTFAAGIAYFGVVFAVGFVFGAFRVLAVEPRLGATVSVAIELPVMLFISWLVATKVVAHFDVGASLKARLAVGAIGLVLLVTAETALGTVFDQSIVEQFTAYGTPRGILNLVGQLGFAAMPLLVRWPRSDK